MFYWHRDDFASFPAFSGSGIRSSAGTCIDIASGIGIASVPVLIGIICFSGYKH